MAIFLGLRTLYLDPSQTNSGGTRPAQAIQNGWQRFFPGNIYRQEGTIVIHERFSASACDAAPPIPPIPDTITAPPVMGGASLSLWTTTDSPITNSFKNQPLAEAPEPNIPAPTKPANVVRISESRQITHLHGKKGQKRVRLNIPATERFDVFTTATKSASYMIVRTGLLDEDSEAYVRIRIYRNAELISNTVYPELPDLAELSLTHLWNADYINYIINPIVSDPCAAEPIQFNNLVRNKLYGVAEIPDLGDNSIHQPKLTIVALKLNRDGGVCNSEMLKTFEYKMYNYTPDEAVTIEAASYYPQAGDP